MSAATQAESVLAQAVRQFNEHCNYAFALPMCREDLLAVARLARARGLDDVADTIEQEVAA